MSGVEGVKAVRGGRKRGLDATRDACVGTCKEVLYLVKYTEKTTPRRAQAKEYASSTQEFEC